MVHVIEIFGHLGELQAQVAQCRQTIDRHRTHHPEIPITCFGVEAISRYADALLQAELNAEPSHHLEKCGRFLLKIPQ
jgi:hypothetical protein